MMILPPFRMADNDKARFGVRQHFRRDVAGMCAGRIGVAILPADSDARALCPGAGTSKKGGQTRMSICEGSFAAPAITRSSLAAAAESPFIFQLPAIRGRRVISHPEARKELAKAL